MNNNNKTWTNGGNGGYARRRKVENKTSFGEIFCHALAWFSNYDNADTSGNGASVTIFSYDMKKKWYYDKNKKRKGSVIK